MYVLMIFACSSAASLAAGAPAAVQAAASQVKTLQAAMFDAHLQMQLALRAKLTPEQWQQWQSLHRGQWHGRRPGPGFGPGK